MVGRMLDHRNAVQAIQPTRTFLNSTTLAACVNVQSRMGSMMLQARDQGTSSILANDDQPGLPIVTSGIALDQENEFIGLSGKPCRSPFPSGSHGNRLLKDRRAGGRQIARPPFGNRLLLFSGHRKVPDAYGLSRPPCQMDRSARQRRQGNRREASHTLPARL